ncbi:MAG TPA: hypothetical protein PKM44_04125 [Turneriella sp.]|nr:hypothetical protein [Turneriella sp.]HMY11265.1 hypothetical protein [Turneriella sp.]HNA79805.1 hypothetical protein [Turneriella sp.]HNE19547.1 hypothetical protein [Turneriella sp.]HNJ64540.1 hypothetical protein [Turneriella sp.]
MEILAFEDEPVQQEILSRIFAGRFFASEPEALKASEATPEEA